MKISDEQLDELIKESKRRLDSINEIYDLCPDTEKLMDARRKRLGDESAVLHILREYKALDKTKDGVRMKPGDTVYRITMMNRIIHDYVAAGTVDDCNVQSCYSTYEAAEEAMKASKKRTARGQNQLSRWPQPQQ
jgi:hypothetical protein